jgi:hypothetical protein
LVGIFDHCTGNRAGVTTTVRKVTFRQPVGLHGPEAHGGAVLPAESSCCRQGRLEESPWQSTVRFGIIRPIFVVDEPAWMGKEMLSPRIARFRVLIPLLVLALLLGATSACGSSPTGKVTYRPPFSPIEISVNTDGKVAISVGSELVTPIGTFGVGADIDEPPSDETLLMINHRGSGGQIVQDRYAISSTQKLGVCFNGSAYGEFGDRRIILHAFDTTSTVRIVASGTACPRPPERRVQPNAVGTLGNYDVVRIHVGGTPLTVLLADTPQEIAEGIPGRTAAELGNIDGMLYALPAPQSFDPATGGGAFIFPGYLFAPEIHFFDANGRYWAGGAAAACSADRSDCRPYYASLYGDPVPYQYVLELVRGKLGVVPPGTPLTA